MLHIEIPSETNACNDTETATEKSLKEMSFLQFQTSPYMTQGIA
jgi:hypothetical protein